MSKEQRLASQIEDLEKHLEKERMSIVSKETCFPTMLILGVLAPIIIWVILFFIQPRFVQDKEGNRQVRSNTKVFYWTVIFTLLVWIGMYLWTWCKGFKNVSLLCARN